VASAADTAAAAAAALLEAEEDMAIHGSNDGFGSYEGNVDPESPLRVEKASTLLIIQCLWRILAQPA